MSTDYISFALQQVRTTDVPADRAGEFRCLVDLGRPRVGFSGLRDRRLAGDLRLAGEAPPHLVCRDEGD